MAENSGRSEASVRIACVQMEPIVGRKRANVDKTIAMLERAAVGGARLVVLPELVNSGYVFESRAEAFESAEEIPGGQTATAWSQAAARLKITIVAGIAERAGPALFNSAVVVPPGGEIGTFRKVHLWNEENLYFEPGNLGFPVFHTPVGRLGMMICYDGWFPEAWRLLALQGADLVCVPTNWVPVPGKPIPELPPANFLCMAAAHSNSMFVAAADRVGTERGQPFLGRSLIVGCDGTPLAGPASATEEEILFADVNLADARRSRNWNAFNQVLRDRRTDVYGEMLGSQLKPGWY
jgi:N-carbamoylputrescine amidase